jgi:hypothetical protein
VETLFVLGAYSYFVIPWLLSGLCYIPRYARYFQYEGYDPNRYAALLSDHEDRFYFTFIFAIGTTYFTFCIGAFFWLYLLSKLFVIAGMMYLALIVLVNYLMPNDPLAKQDLAPTPQTMRLLTIAFFVELIPVIIGALVIVKAYDSLINMPGSAESMIVFVPIFSVIMIALATAFGPITFLFTRYTVPIADRIDQVLRM